ARGSARTRRRPRDRHLLHTAARDRDDPGGRGRLLRRFYRDVAEVPLRIRECTMSDTHRLIIDRFEEDLAVVEVDGERFLEVPRLLLPDGAGEDDVIRVRRSAEGAGLVLELEVDAEATAEAREEARRLVEELRARDPGGDLVL